MTEKHFHIRADQIKTLAEGRGGCFATDMITVEGRKVGFMYRQAGEFAADSGWRFLAGSESQEYLDASEHLTIYDVNTIANYDTEIIPLLDAPFGSAFERSDGGGPLIEVEYDPGE